MTESTPTESLYGSEPSLPPVKAPNLLEQIEGVFTEPVALFGRLEATPVWGWALGLLSLLNLVAGVLWALKVDVDAMLRPILEKNPNIPAESLDKIIALQGKMLLPMSILGGLFGLAFGCLILSLVFWLIARFTFETRLPSFKLVYSASVVSSLVQIPKIILLAIICGLKNIGGARPEALSPTSLGFYMTPDNVKLHALFNTLDLFTVATLVMTFLAARHALRLKPLGAALCAAAVALLLLIPVAFAQ